ncbi:MAG: metal ABC transporter solute-binding protein, Zn/Mn family [Solirubrobacteraceae bacterium]
MGRRARYRTLAAPAVLAALAAGAAGCGRSGPPAVRSGFGGAGAHFVVVAAENFWGSLAGQLAGTHASVSSIVVNPASDPHSYQATTGDARRLTLANMVIVNGLGYDRWATQLLSAAPAPGRVVLDVGKRLGLAEGSNPHRWYYPGDVRAVIGAIAAAYERLDPADAAYFRARRHWLESSALARWDELRATIRSRYKGVPVGYSESIFQGMGEDLGLRLLTPASFVKAVAEGTDVTAADKQTVDAQARGGSIKMWVFNSQNVTPDVQRVNQIVQRRGIPVARVTETLEPATDSFEQWQAAELEGVLKALGRTR